MQAVCNTAFTTCPSVEGEFLVLSQCPKCEGNQASIAESGRLLCRLCLLQEVLHEQMADFVPVVSNTLLFQPILSPCKAGVSWTLLNPLGKLKGM